MREMRYDKIDETYTHRDLDGPLFPEDLLIIKCFRGISPIRQHMEGIGLAMAAQEFASRWCQKTPFRDEKPLPF